MSSTLFVFFLIVPSVRIHNKYICGFILPTRHSTARYTEICPPSGWRRPPGRPRQARMHRIGNGFVASIHREL